MTLRPHRAGLGLLTALALVLIPTPAFAGALELQDGRRLQIAAGRYDAATRTVALRLEDGALTRLALDELDGRALFQALRGRTTASDARGQLAVGHLARDLGLREHAERQYLRTATSSDRMVALEAELALARLRIAGLELELAQARAALAEPAPTRRPVTSAEAARDAGEELLPFAGELDELRARIAKLDEAARDGLSARAGNRAVRAWERGLEQTERLVKRLDELGARHDDVCSAAALAALRAEVDARRLELHLHLASHWSVRSSLPRALERANAALAIDPAHERALAARERLQDAGSDAVPWPLPVPPGPR